MALIALDGDLIVKDGFEDRLMAYLSDFDDDVKQEKNRVIFSFYRDVTEDQIEELVSSIKDLVIEGSIEIFDEDETEWATYIFSNGKCEYANGIPLIYYLGHAELFVEKLPRDIIDAVLKKYGNQSNQSF